jgi:hypothetical protein
MLTSYLVHCPYPECSWFGSLLPCRDTDSWKCSVPSAAIATFVCPQCHQEWKARIEGDDIVPLPLNEQPHPV